MEPHDARPVDRATLERILDVARQLAEPLDVAELLARIIDAARSVLSADRGTVFLYEPEANELTVSVATGLAPIRIPADKGIVGECVQSRAVVNVPDAYADPRFNRDVDRETGYRTRCLLTVPLLGHDGVLVGVLQLLNKDRGAFDADDERVATTLAAQCAVALQRARMTEALVEKERLDRELAVAREIQAAVLPREMPEMPGYDVAATTRPAEETGGDIFDLVPLQGGRLVLLLGDATGHGVGPALSVTQVRAMLRIALRLDAELDSAFTHINDQLSDDLAENRFVTAFLGVLDGTAHRVTYHSGGQGPLMHFHAAEGRVEWLKATTLPMGMMGGLPLKPARTMELAPGDVVGLITDGVFEAENESARQFGAESVEAIVRRHHDGPMQRLLEALLEAVDRFSGTVPQADDITIVLLRRSS